MFEVDVVALNDVGNKRGNAFKAPWGLSSWIRLQRNV